LDIKHQLFILNHLKKSGKTIVIVLHYLQKAAHFCDKIYLIDSGKNVSEGTPKTVLTQENVRKIFELNGEARYTETGSCQFNLEME